VTRASLDGLVVDALLLDLDGTLVDSAPAVERSWRRWALSWGLGADLVVTHGVPARQVLAGLVPPDEVEPAFAALEAIEVADVDGVVALPGAVRTLDALPAGRAAIATSGTRPLAAARIRAAGLAAPAVVVTADDVPVGKPDPAPYLLAARRLGVDPARCLVVEDAPAGLLAGRAAGCRTLALLTTHPAGELALAAPDAVLPTLAGLTVEARPGGLLLRVDSPA
jgi:sugar-phosphatase